MRNLFLSITTLFMCLNFCDADEPSRIAKVTTSKTKATITGVGDSKLEVVLRLGKTKHTKKLEWTSSAVGPFSAHAVSTDRIPLGNNKFGNGIVFTVQAGGVVSASNISMSDGDPVPAGTVRFRPKQSKSKKTLLLKQAGDTVAVADIICEDGSSIPVSMLVRDRQITKP